MKRKQITYTLLENGYPHTTGLSYSSVIEMIERYSRIFPDNEYCYLAEPNAFMN